MIKDYKVEEVFSSATIDEPRAIRCVRAKWVDEDKDRTFHQDVIELNGGNPEPTDEEAESGKPDPTAIMTCEQALVVAAEIEGRSGFNHDVLNGFVWMDYESKEEAECPRMVIRFFDSALKYEDEPKEGGAVLIDNVEIEPFARILRAVAEAHIAVAALRSRR